MKAVILNEFGGADVLKIATLPNPVAGAGEVLIRIHAAGVNPIDVKIRKGLVVKRIPHQFPIIPGWEAAGVVEAVGEGVTYFRAGDEVYTYCRKPIVQFGAYAEYVVVAADHVAFKPKTLTFEQAASIPLAGLTAWQSLMDVAQLRSGQTALIHAAAGGVGGFAVQIAKHAGADVLATASSRNHAYVKSLGADEVIDYTQVDFRDAVKERHPEGVDMVFDTVGGDVQVRSADTVKKGGTLVSILAYQDEDALIRLGIQTRYHFVNPGRSDLDTLARMVDQGALKTHVSSVFALESVSQAHQQIETQHTVGKLILLPNSDVGITPLIE